MPPEAAALLARGPWETDSVIARWSEQAYEPPPEKAAAADSAVAALARRGSPSHDGMAGRLAAHSLDDAGRLVLDLQPVRWALRLVDGDASCSGAALCAVRSGDGRWLAGRRAPWVSSWPGRWALGAGGAVDVGESPAHTLVRELDEEWSVTPERVRAEALVRLPQRLVMLIGQAWLPDGAEVTPDHEHDAHAWWPADIARWPAEADAPLRRMAALLDAAAA
jgi:8-oxo-dGTP diphosphatase